MANPIYHGAGTITPAPNQVTSLTNYIDFTAGGTGGTNGWAQQYLPDLMEQEAEVYGNRTISGFLAQVGAEEAMTADQVVWSEQGRLHISRASTAGGHTVANGLIVFAAAHPFVVNDTVLVHATAGGGVGTTLKCLVTAINAGGTVSITAIPYTQAALDTSGGMADGSTFQVLKYGSEFRKGSSDVTGSISPGFKSHSNKPVIIRDRFQINGSDASQIGWVEVSGEEGQNGYLWYLKAEGDTRARFADYLEMMCIEGEKSVGTQLNGTLGTPTDDADQGHGTEGLFAAVRKRGIVADSSIGGAVTPANALGAFDLLLKEFDKQGAIEENMMFLNRDLMLSIDDMLGGNFTNNAGAGSSFGLFNNSADMALNLGFTGFRRGSYDFYKSDWKYLNDSVTRGVIDDITGICIPAGTSTVYDQNLGKNMRRPFLHVRYRASQADNRKMKTWITGSVGAATSDLDAMTVNYLSERCLVTQGGMNFCLFTK